jgi:hypothetical protein
MAMIDREPRTLEEAEQRLYSLFPARAGWISVLRFCQAYGLPEPAKPQTIAEWMQLERLIRSKLEPAPRDELQERALGE